MACRHPLAAWQLSNGEVVFRERAGADSVRSLFLPCGQCVACRLERSRQWAVRCVHEAKMHERNCFITLTYDDRHLPADKSLKYSDYSAFMRRLRKYVKRRCRSKVSTLSTVRFYMCGEYGETTARPHYHALLFGFDFEDKLYFKRCPSGEKLYTSTALGRLWPLGSHMIGSVTFESAAYVARYCVDKVTGGEAKAHYEVVDPSTGEVRSRVPEFNRCSLRPAVGRTFIDKFMADVYPSGKVVINGRLAKAPRYYDKVFLRSATPDQVERLEFARWKDAQLVGEGELSDERLAVKEEVALARLALFRREI